MKTKLTVKAAYRKLYSDPRLTESVYRGQISKDGRINFCIYSSTSHCRWVSFIMIIIKFIISKLCSVICRSLCPMLCHCWFYDMNCISHFRVFNFWLGFVLYPFIVLGLCYIFYHFTPKHFGTFNVCYGRILLHSFNVLSVLVNRNNKFRFFFVFQQFFVSLITCLTSFLCRY